MFKPDTGTSLSSNQILNMKEVFSMKATEIFNVLIQSGLLATLLGFVVTGVKYGKSFLDAKTAEVTANIKDANVKNAINSAENCITTVTAEMSQTVGEDLKAKSADGKLTAEDAAQIKADAVAKVQSLLSDDILQTITTVHGDAEAWISSKIEAAVKAAKTISATAVAATTTYTPSITVNTTAADSTDAPTADTATVAATPAA